MTFYNGTKSINQGVLIACDLGQIFRQSRRGDCEKWNCLHLYAFVKIIYKRSSQEKHGDVFETHLSAIDPLIFEECTDWVGSRVFVAQLNWARKPQVYSPIHRLLPEEGKPRSRRGWPRSRFIADID